MPALLSRARQLVLAPDTAQRHRQVSDLCAGATEILDVGGVRHQLEAFVRGPRITTLNLGDEGDERFDGETIPRGDASVDVVTSLDVLEHIPREQRRRHLAECARVASRRVVLCCPLGTPEHTAAERELADWLAEQEGTRVPFLDEHVERGLPTREELVELSAGLDGVTSARLLFQGDFRAVEAALRAYVAATRRKTPAAAWRYLGARRGIRVNEPARDEPTPHTNRVFLVLEKAP